MTRETRQQGYRRPYQVQQSRWWWLQNRFFSWYMLREATALWVLVYCLVLFNGLVRLNQGEAAWNQWLQSLAHPLWIVFHVCVLGAVVYHALTWFRLAPKIIVLRLGAWTLPDKAMMVGQWLGLLVFSAVFLGIAVMQGG